MWAVVTVVAFVSLATNLVAGDSNGVYDVFRHDRQTGTTIRVSVSDAEAQMATSGAFGPTMTADGRYVTFTSASANLVVGDGNDDSDVFLRDVVAGTTSVSRTNKAVRMAVLQVRTCSPSQCAQ